MKRLFFFITILPLLSCQDGPRAAYNEEFEVVNPKKELSFKKLVGEYYLDSDSKKRYKIMSTDSLKFIIKKDSSFTAENYLDYKNDTLKIKKLEGKLLYRNNFKESIMYLRTKDDEFNGGSGFQIYYRKKDNILALYVYTPMIPATKENNYSYREGDYLRYIKVK